MGKRRGPRASWMQCAQGRSGAQAHLFARNSKRVVHGVVQLHIDPVLAHVLHKLLQEQAREQKAPEPLCNRRITCPSMRAPCSCCPLAKHSRLRVPGLHALLQAHCLLQSLCTPSLSCPTLHMPGTTTAAVDPASTPCKQLAAPRACSQ